MPQRQGGVRRRVDPAELEPFERPEAVWRELGAPVDLYDLEAAAAAELYDVQGAGPVLKPGEPGYPGPSWFYARRWWRRHRPAFLAEAGQLTPRERALVTSRRPARERPE